MLEKYSFLWSEARLLIAAVALLIGGYPPILRITPFFLYGIVAPLLNIAWIISGVASGYLLYRWIKVGKKLFGANVQLDMIAFLVAVVSGFNLGFTGLTGRNIGMSIFGNYIFFVIAALAYLWSAYHLYTRWNASGKKLF
jgi:uncharacterized membrane protein YuzA (DUF378 family)